MGGKVAGTAVALAAIWLCAGTAQAAPGVPEPPQVIYTEDFEHGMSNTAVGLASYTGAPPLAMTYTAHPTWLDGSACNGIIASRNSPASNGTLGCPADVYSRWVNGLAEAMGGYHGTGDDDHVLVHTTVAGANNAPTPATILQTDATIPLPATGRYVSFSIDVAVRCNGADPLLRFFLLDGTEEIPAFDGAAINPCTGPASTLPTTTGLGPVRVATYPPDGRTVYSLTAAGQKVGKLRPGRKFKISHTSFGNDYAVDNIRMVDATPTLDKQFVPARINPPGEPVSTTSMLTFTVTNTADLGAKRGWSFTDSVPDGIDVVGTAGSTCANSTVDVSGSTVTAGGDLPIGEKFCTVTVPVGAPTGEYVNASDDVTVVGLNPPGDATLSVNHPPTVDIDVPVGGEEYMQGQVVPAGYSCADADGTVDSCSGPVADGDPIDTSRVGTHSFTVTGVDDEGADGTHTVTYRVRPIVRLCRGTAVRVLDQRRIAANLPLTPCSTETAHQAVFNVHFADGGPLAPVLAPVASDFVRGELLNGATADGPPRQASARSSLAAASMSVLGRTIAVTGLHSEADAAISGCRTTDMSGRSRIATLTLNGVPIPVGEEPRTIPLGSGALHLNQQVRTGNTITQRALHLDLPGTASDVTLGEAEAGAACG